MTAAIWVLDALIGGVVLVRAVRRLIPTHKHAEGLRGTGVRAPLRAPTNSDERGAA